ncbi:hypothetical protein ACTXT7_002121 [Hymenolepis weldensis]
MSMFISIQLYTVGVAGFEQEHSIEQLQNVDTALRNIAVLTRKMLFVMTHALEAAPTVHPTAGLACRNKLNGDTCISSCPPKHQVNQVTSRQELNPEFKYDVHDICVKECPGMNSAIAHNYN